MCRKPQLRGDIFEEAFCIRIIKNTDKTFNAGVLISIYFKFADRRLTLLQQKY